MTKKEDSRVRVFPDLTALSYQAGERFLELCTASVQNRGRFAVALSGGSTPETLYRVLASPLFNERVPWHAVHVFWGDERCVSPDNPESNYGMAREALLAHVPIPAGNIHRMPGEVDPRQGASSYEKELRDFFSVDAVPVFDLVLLGLGKDGHTASLFPLSEALKAKDRLVMLGASPDNLQPRLTLTLNVINNAAVVLFLVAGTDKAEILSQVFTEHQDPDRIPAQGVQPASGELYWYLDPAAARLLK